MRIPVPRGHDAIDYWFIEPGHTFSHTRMRQCGIEFAFKWQFDASGDMIDQLMIELSCLIGHHSFVAMWVGRPVVKAPTEARITK
jgi:hypothetical protein